MEMNIVLKALAEETRLKIVKMLLRHNYCVRALSRNLGLSEAAISQHLKVLREAGLLVGEKKGYFMHYDVDRKALRQLASEIEELARIEREICNPERVGCEAAKQKRCHVQKNGTKCSDEVKSFCHGDNGGERGSQKNGNCQCHKS